MSATSCFAQGWGTNSLGALSSTMSPPSDRYPGSARVARSHLAVGSVAVGKPRAAERTALPAPARILLEHSSSRPCLHRLTRRRYIDATARTRRALHADRNPASWSAPTGARASPGRSRTSPPRLLPHRGSRLNQRLQRLSLWTTSDSASICRPAAAMRAIRASRTEPTPFLRATVTRTTNVERIHHETQRA